MCQRTASILWLILCLLVGAGTAKSQPIREPDGAKGSIGGLVIDQQGAVVPAAYVTAKNMKTAQTFTARSGADGAFAIQGLDAGDYEVQVSAPGFANYLMRITLTPGSAEGPHDARLQATVGTAQITVAMHPGGETTQVCIVCGYTYFSLPFRSLPLIDRDPQELIRLQTGVAEHSGAFSINGARTSGKISLLDGFDDRNSRSGDFVAGVSLDSVSEFNSDYYAETSVESNYGPNRTPEIAATTNSGSNHVHADAFWYGSRTGLNGNGFFTNRGGFHRSRHYTIRPELPWGRRSFYPGSSI